MSEWEWRTIDQCAAFISGGTPSKDNDAYWQGDIPWVSPKDMYVHRITDSQDHLSITGVENGSRLIPPKSILMVVRSMTLGRRFQVAITERQVSFNQDIKALLCFDNIVPEFLFYSLLAHSDLILALVDEASHGTKRLRTEAISGFEIPIPVNLDTQREIAHILGTLDDKIDLNRKMNATLEAMARALFKSWFVDFDPVRAKAEGRDPAGMDAETAALFPDGFEVSPLGAIPRGWRVGTIADVLELERESVTPADSPSEIFAHYGLPAFDEGQMPKLDLGEAIKSSKYLVRPGAVLLSKLNPSNMKVWVPLDSGENREICSTEFLVLRAKSYYSREYVFSLVSSDAFAHRFAGLVTGTSTSHQRVQPKVFLRMDVVLPPKGLVAAFSAMVRQMFTRSTKAKVESRTLAEMRDALLPRLMRGELVGV